MHGYFQGNTPNFNRRREALRERLKAVAKVGTYRKPNDANETRMTNDEKAVRSARFSGFVIRISFVIRHSDFVIAVIACQERIFVDFAL